MSLFWISLALLFNIFIYYFFGYEPALNFLAGYLIEKSLSVDNLFVFIMIFSYFKVPTHLVHKVLFWGVLGAILARALFIWLGITLIEQYHWVFYLFGLFLIYTGYKFALNKEKEMNPENNLLIRFFQRFFPFTKNYVDDHFFIKIKGKLFATPLLAALIAIETTDIIFAIDSIPAIIGITTEPFIVYTSNILAILGLRSLYFALAHLLELFHYLNEALALILIFIGLKMLLIDTIHIPILYSLLVILFILGAALVVSIFYPKK